MSKRMWRLGNAAFVAGLLLLLVPPVRSQVVEGKVAELDKNARSERDGTENALVLGAPVRDGDTLMTDEGGRLFVNFEDRSVVKLFHSAELLVRDLVFAPTGFRTLHHLRSGAVHVYCRKGSDVQIETPTATTKCAGTDFIVSYDPVAETTRVVGVTGEAEVTAVAECAGRTVTLTRRETTIVAKGSCPTPPTLLDEWSFGQLVAQGQFIGGGHNETIAAAPSIVLSPRRPADVVHELPGPRDECQTPASCVKQPLVVPGRVRVEF